MVKAKSPKMLGRKSPKSPKSPKMTANKSPKAAKSPKSSTTSPNSTKPSLSSKVTSSKFLALKKSKDTSFRKRSLDKRRNLQESQPEKSKPEKRGIIFVSNIPHGFFEREMSEYFRQFGTIRDLRVARSKKTGESCGYAYVEFDHYEVAQIVAQHMDGYLTFGKIMKCSYIPANRVSDNVFKGKDIRPYNCPKVVARRKAVNRLNSFRTLQQQHNRLDRILTTYSKKMKKLEESGIKVELDLPPKEQTLGEIKEAISIQEQEAEEARQMKEMAKEREKLAEKIKASLSKATRRKETLKKEKTAVKRSVRLLNTKSGQSQEEEKMVLEVAESEDEITFKTPPNTVKRYIKSGSPKANTSSATPKKRKAEATPSTTTTKEASSDSLDCTPPPAIKTAKGTTETPVGKLTPEKTKKSPVAKKKTPLAKKETPTSKKLTPKVKKMTPKGKSVSITGSVSDVAPAENSTSSVQQAGESASLTAKATPSKTMAAAELSKTTQNNKKNATPGKKKATPGKKKTSTELPKTTPDKAKAAADLPEAKPGKKEDTSGNIKTTPGKEKATTGLLKTTPGKKKTGTELLKTTPEKAKAASELPKTTPGKKATTGKENVTPGKKKATTELPKTTPNKTKTFEEFPKTTPGKTKVAADLPKITPGKGKIKTSTELSKTTPNKINRAELPKTTPGKTKASTKFPKTTPGKVQDTIDLPKTTPIKRKAPPEVTSESEVKKVKLPGDSTPTNGRNSSARKSSGIRGTPSYSLLSVPSLGSPWKVTSILEAPATSQVEISTQAAQTSPMKKQTPMVTQNTISMMNSHTPSETPKTGKTTTRTPLVMKDIHKSMKLIQGTPKSLLKKKVRTPCQTAQKSPKTKASNMPDMLNGSSPKRKKQEAGKDGLTGKKLKALTPGQPKTPKMKKMKVSAPKSA